MAYFIDLFSPETYEVFSQSSRNVSGFRLRQRNRAERVNPGDIFVCYLTRLSRWSGVLEVIEGPFINDTPVWSATDDPFVVRFRVKPVVWLSVEQAIPMHDDAVWSGLSFTRELEKGSSAWAAKVRGSLVRLSDSDGSFLVEMLTEQAARRKTFALSEQDQQKLATHLSRTSFQ